jgi:transposase InsO family protein
MNRGLGNPLGLGLVVVGAFAMAIAAFLPLDQPTGVFRMVQDNTLIQRGGWMLVALAVGIAVSGFRVSQRGNGWAVPVVLCVSAGILIARSEGWIANHKRLQRLWRREGLRVPQRRRRKRIGASTTSENAVADAPNRVWAGDFQFDGTTDGRPIKIVSIVDEHTRECLGGLVERSVTADVLIDELDRLAAQRGYPAVQRCDNGPELACAAMADCAGDRLGLGYIPPGEPWRNGYIESFNSRVRDECL